LCDLKVSAERLPQESAAVRSTSLFDVRIAYADTVDVAAEKTRLMKEIEVCRKPLRRRKGSSEMKTFRSRAPEENH